MTQNRNPQPAWWALYLGIGLLLLVVVSNVIVATMPADLKAFMDDPTAVTFRSAEMGGRTCGQMKDEALVRGAHRWACWK